MPLTSIEAARFPLATLTGSTTGLVGQITADNFGVNAIRYPINWDDVTTGPVNRTGVAGHLARATQQGNWVRIFFGLNSNGRGGSEAGLATGIFCAGTLEFTKLSGELTGYQTSAAVSDGATSIPIDTGAVAIGIGTHIQFDNYFVYTTTNAVTGSGTLTVTPAVRGGIADNTVMRYATVGGLYETNGAVARLATTIAIDAGAGPIPVGTEVEFDNSEYVYTVTAGTTGPGTITVTPPVQQAIADNAAMRINSRLNELRYALDACHAAGLKVLLALEGRVPTTDSDMELYRDQLSALLRGLPRGGNMQATLIDAIEPSNEVFQQQQNHGITLPRIAEMMRITAALFRANSPQTIVLSCSYQGGEATGSNEVLSMMAASAAGVVVNGDGGGTGTTGEQFFDHFAFHPYIENLSTIAEARAALSDSRAPIRVRDFLDPIKTAVTTRRAANPSYWTGRADPEIWATEYNVNPGGDVQTSNLGFRMQAFTPVERGLLVEQVVLGAFASGATKVFPYAVDHHFTQGPIGQLTCSAVNGELRMDTASAGSTAILDGDAVYVSNFGGWGVAYNATDNGVLSTAKGIPSNGSPTQYYQVTAYRWQLGGWAEQYPLLQAKFIGLAETGWLGTGSTAAPEYRIGRGQVFRAVAGRLTGI